MNHSPWENFLDELDCECSYLKYLVSKEKSLGVAERLAWSKEPHKGSTAS